MFVFSDSTDLPHLAWLSACVSSRFKMHFYERLDKEIREAVHDLKKRRVVKRKGSSDDQFQTVVGAFYLSDTIGSTTATIPERVNVVSARSAMRLAQSCGYNVGTAMDPHTHCPDWGPKTTCGSEPGLNLARCSMRCKRRYTLHKPLKYDKGSI